MTKCRFRSIPVGFAEQSLSAGAIALYAAAYTSNDTKLCGAVFASTNKLADLAGFNARLLGTSRARRVDAAIKELGAMVRWWPDHGILFIRGFAMMQAANPNIWIGAMSSTQHLPRDIISTVQADIKADFLEAVDQEKTYFASTLEKIEKMTVVETVLQPLPKPFQTVPETHARVGACLGAHVGLRAEQGYTGYTGKPSLSLKGEVNEERDGRFF